MRVLITRLPCRIALSVIRMIKMFGWERKMTEHIDEKREIEMNWIFWNKVYGLITMMFQ